MGGKGKKGGKGGKGDYGKGFGGTAAVSNGEWDGEWYGEGGDRCVDFL